MLLQLLSTQCVSFLKKSRNTRIKFIVIIVIHLFKIVRKVIHITFVLINLNILLKLEFDVLSLKKKVSSFSSLIQVTGV